MPLTDREQELVELLNRCLEQLERSTRADPATVEPFAAQDAAVQRWLQLAIQCCLDLGDSLLGKLGEPEPARYRDIFSALHRRGIIDAALARRMERLTDVRNALAHAYASLKPAETWRHVRDGLPALAEFGKRMAQE